MLVQHSTPRKCRVYRLGLLPALSAGCLLTATAALAGNNQLCDASDKSIPEPFESNLIRADDTAAALKAANPLIVKENVPARTQRLPAVERAEPDALGEPLSSPSAATEPLTLPLTTRVPGLSDDAMARYRRLMYRKDI